MTGDGRARKLFLPIGRRRLLGGLGAGLVSGLHARRAGADSAVEPHDDLANLRLVDDREGGRRFVLVVPKYLQPGVRLPLVVLLHGLGETTDERLGAHAWVDKYGLGSAWQRLKRAPITRSASARGEWTDTRLAEVNAELAARPFRGMVMACPFMPNPKSAADLDAYARWLDQSLLPRVRREAPVSSKTYLCGVSLGGYVSLEMLVRLPASFDAWAGVQTAITPAAAPRYAEKIARAPGGLTHPMMLLTSTQDHWKASSEALAAAFEAKGMKATYRVVPGPHDQPWLREAGTIEALLWLDRISYATSRAP